jgi:hypothetical protein
VERVKEASASRRDTAVERLCARFLEQRSSASGSNALSSSTSTPTAMSPLASPSIAPPRK